MTLFEKIMVLHPDLKQEDFGFDGSILLQNDSNGNGDYIAKWHHPIYPKPTDDQLA